MDESRKITRERANEIIKEHWNKPVERVVICYRGWWDIRGMSDEQVNKFISELIKN